MIAIETTGTETTIADRFMKIEIITDGNPAVAETEIYIDPKTETDALFDFI